MQLTLRPEIEEFIQSQVEAGRYASADDLVMNAIQWLMVDEVRDSELDDETIAAINRAEEQFKRGEGVDFDAVAAQWRKRIGRA